MQSQAGQFIVIEGLDGAGTTTQCATLARWLRAQNVEVHTTCEPTDGAIGRLIRSTLRQEEGHVDKHALPWLFAADRADHIQTVVLPTLNTGTWVLSDRYVPSSLAYQSLSMPIDWVAELNAPFPRPILTLFLDVPVDECMRRIHSRDEVREIFERKDKLEQVAKNYESVLTFMKNRGDHVIRVDATGAKEDTAAAIASVIQETLL